MDKKSKMSICNNCKNQVQDTWKICPFCGAKLTWEYNVVRDPNQIYYSYNYLSRDIQVVLKSLNLNQGTRLDRFELEKIIGAGSEGVVWMVEDMELEMMKALKIIPLINRDEKKFFTTYKKLASLPVLNGILPYEKPIKLSYLGQDMVILPLPYMKDGSLREKLQDIFSEENNRKRENLLLDIFLKLLEHVKAIHRNNIAHLDLKPENILFNNQTMMLIDFGNFEDETDNVDIFENQKNYPYLAPEQLNDADNSIDSRIDIYAIGIMLYEVFTNGKIPIKDENYQIDQSFWKDDKFDNLPLSLQKIIIKCLLKDPNQRFRSIERLSESLKQLKIEIGINRKKVDALIDNARNNLDKGNYEQALKYLNSAIDIEPLNQTIKNAIEGVTGSQHERSKEYSETQEYFSEKNFIFIPEQEFTMGNIKGQDCELPKHKVIVKSFYINKYPVRLFEWRLFTQQCYQKFDWIHNSWGKNPVSKFCINDNYPIINISWFEAIEFCNWKSRLEGFTECYQFQAGIYVFDENANGYRLPTEAEWECAAIGGKHHEDVFSGANHVDEVAWIKSNTDALQESGLLKPNTLGLYDMSGNVLEWCWDWFSETYYNESEYENPLGPETGSKKVLRGGSWKHDAEIAAVFSRSKSSPDVRREFIGFRICKGDQ